MKVAVIGSGPCGALAALLLLENGFKVDMYGLDNHDSISSPNLNRTLKLVGLDSSCYDINQILKIEVNGELGSFYRSKIAGGFSNVWGATWGSPIIRDESSWIQHYELATKKVRSSLGYLPKNIENREHFGISCDCLDFLNTFNGKKIVNFGVTDLAINPDICGCIESGLNFCTHGSIWNSTRLIDECLKFNTFSLFPSVDIQRFFCGVEGIKLDVPDSSRTYQKVVLAMGSLGISENLLNSVEGIESIQLQENRMGYLPFFRFRINTGHAGAFAFSKYRFDLEDGLGGLGAHIQLYAHPELYKDRILGKIPSSLHLLVNRLFKLLYPHLGIALIYLNSDYSESMVLKSGKDYRKLLVKIIQPKRTFNLAKNLWGAFRSLGLVPILPAISWSKVGESYHVGSAVDLVDDFGFLKLDNRIAVAGSFALSKMLAGPITHAAMAQTSRLVEEIHHQNFESTWRV